MLWFKLFYPWFKFYFPLFLGMVMYDNELETRKKLSHNTYIVHYSAGSKTLLHIKKIILYHDKGLEARAKNIDVTFSGKKVH